MTPKLSITSAERQDDIGIDNHTIILHLSRQGNTVLLEVNPVPASIYPPLHIEEDLKSLHTTCSDTRLDSNPLPKALTIFQAPPLQLSWR